MNKKQEGLNVDLVEEDPISSEMLDELSNGKGDDEDE